MPMTPGTVQVHILAVHNVLDRFANAFAFRTEETIAGEITLHGHNVLRQSYTQNRVPHCSQNSTPTPPPADHNEGIS